MRPSNSSPQPNVTVRREPINRLALTAAAFAAVAAIAWPTKSADPSLIAVSLVAGAVSASVTLRLSASLMRDYRLRRNVALSRAKNADHGSARQSTNAERNAAGMDDWRNGELYGLDEAGRPVWRKRAAPFALTVIPPGGFKTTSFVIGSILHRAVLGFSVLVPDVKMELAPLLVPALRALGYEVWCINPSGRHESAVVAVEVNLYQPLLDAVNGDADVRDAAKLAADYAELHHPVGKDEKNPYFARGSQRAIMLALLILALTNPGNCTPTGVYMLLTNPARLLALCAQLLHFEVEERLHGVLAVAQAEARNLLERAEKNEENFASFLEGASQKLLSFNPSGHLGDYGANAVHNLRDIRSRQIIVFLMTPLSHLREFADFISLANHNIIAACKAIPDGVPVHIVGEEALNYRFGNVVSDMETLRQLGVTIDLYVQSHAGLGRHYGRESAAAIEAMADIRIYGGLNAYDDAKRVSDMLASSTIKKQDFSFGSTVTEVNLSTRDMGRPLMTPDEVLAMRKGTAWMFVNGMRPVKLTLIPYVAVEPWRSWLATSELHDRFPNPVVSIPYPGGGRHD